MQVNYIFSHTDMPLLCKADYRMHMIHKHQLFLPDAVNVVLLLLIEI